MIFPELGLTKKDLADYYATVEPLIMVDAAKPADDPDPLSPGHAPANAFSRSTTRGRSARM